MGTQVATGYTGNPRRVFVVDAFDPRYGSSISAGFRAGMRGGLARCRIAAADFKPDAMNWTTAAAAPPRPPPSTPIS